MRLHHKALAILDSASYNQPNYGQSDVVVLVLNRENYDFPNLKEKFELSEILVLDN